MKSQSERPWALQMCREIIHDLYDAIRHCYGNSVVLGPHIRDMERDLRIVEKRYAAEGIGFCTKQLPKLGKFLDQKLGEHEADATSFHSDASGYPVFLRSFWTLVREYPVSELRPAQVARVILIARTLFYGFYKLEVPFSPAQEQAKLSEFLATEEEVSQFEMPSDNRVSETARHLVSKALTGFNLSDPDFRRTLVPKHGPGAVASGERGEQKWYFTHLYDTLHQRFPTYDYMFGVRSSGRSIHLAARAASYRKMERLPFPVAKLIFVPKDSRGPRIISSEPLELQFMQQAVAIPLARHLEAVGFSRGHINFTDQSINALLALQGSKSRHWATLDLREASDRVSCLLVRSLFPDEFIEDLMALRSYATLLPDGSRILLRKYAPMGSALCFPIESLVFWALCVAALRVAGYTENEARRNVYVYGDDIIVPTDCALAVVDALESHGLSVNLSKSYYKGFFRESCGMDAWLGQDVTPQRFRKLPGSGPQDVTANYAWAAYSSSLIKKGMPRAARFAQCLVERNVGPLPRTTIPTSYLSIVDPSNPWKVTDYKGVRWCVGSCYPTCRLYAAQVPQRDLSLDDYERLNMNLLGSWQERDPSVVVARAATKMSYRRHSLIEFSLEDWAQG
jgi:hypothetical protein